MPAARPYIDRKQSFPSPLRTRDWDRLGAQVTERAWFMAGVQDARILQEFRACTEKIVDGEMSGVEARRHLREFLNGIGYMPESAEDIGTMQDLSSTRRMKVALETNVALAHGWAQHAEDLRDRRNPAQELYRQHARQAPRDWVERWNAAAEQVNFEGVARDRMIALTTSPIWVALSRFGHPYPPFDFNSGMGTRPVDAEMARKLGCFGDDPQTIEREEARQQADAEESANTSLNENTELEVALDEDLEADLRGALKGIAEVEKGLARMKDVNGTTPLTPEQATAMFEDELPEGVPNLQRDAYELYRKAPLELDEEGEEAQACLADFMARMEKAQGKGDAEDEVGRALPFADDADFKRMLESMDKAGTYSAKAGRAAEAWTAATSAASYATGKNNVILVARRYKSRVKAESLDKALGLLTEAGASLFPGKVRWRVVRKVADVPNAQGGRDVTYEVEEA